MKLWNLPVVEVISAKEVTESQKVILVYTNPAYNAVKEKLGFSAEHEVEVMEATLDHWKMLMEGISGDVIYGVGGGLAIDAAKYLAVKLNLPLISIPTALSVDAFLTSASGYREQGGVKYLETKPPDTLIIDYEILASAPPSIRAAGICDVLSITTGCWDWQFAEDQGKNPESMAFIPYVEKVAMGILQGALDCASAAGMGDPDGLKQLLDCLAMEVQLCNQIGHSRPEEGSEHYFAYAVENVMGKGLPHGDLVGPGILLMAALQGQDIAPLQKALINCQIPVNNIPPEVVRQVMLDQSAYCRKHDLPFGISHTLTEKDLDRIPELS